MGGDDDGVRHAAQVRHKPDDLLTRSDVEVGGRLIQQQHRRVERNADGERGASHLASGHQAAIAVRELSQAEAREQLLRALPRVRDTACTHGELDIGADRVFDKHLLGILIDKRDGLGELVGP